MAPKYKFHEGEKVLCFHGPILYEAKCVKIQAKDKVVKYFVHYQGWNKSWDEWVPESRVLKYNEANVQKQKELQEAHNAVKPKGKSKKRASGDKEAAATPKTDKTAKPKPGTITAVTPTEPKDSGEKETGGKKRRIKVDQTSEEDYQNLPEVKIMMPEELKTILKEDWEMVNKSNKLVVIPAQSTVDDILEDYVSFKKKESTLTPPKISIIYEITNGIREYFNVVLGSLLLYKSERLQFEQSTKEGEDIDILPSSIYGFIHLLRLFVKFGNLLAHSHTDEKSIQSLIPHFDDFLSFCAKHSTSYYSLEDYTSQQQHSDTSKKSSS
ncbi:mortality factor 4-like protein 1 [Tetranychus urticae]|uniref:Chromo domain-containing protein n=1 Tax=Tetranychus urticae TaxID=32264 RepID=T1KDE5_TETUR|nr:mortality factor 4-like protein 1 [Tetranychus urticae]